jgi:multiple sugar transport system substrate-binding protein
MLYRSDIFQKYGIEVPKTWDQFAAAARKLHQDSKGVVYLTTFSVTDLAATLDAWIWNMGGNTIQPVEGQKDTYRIFLNSPETKKVIEYWGALVDEKVIPSVAFYSEQADRMFSNNEFASMPIAAAWFGPCVLTKSYPQQATLWRIAPHPQWSEGENVQGMHGGSVIGVAKNAKYPNAAALFAMWCCASNPGVVMGWDQCVWTANQRILKEESTFGEHYKYYYGGQDYRDFLIPAAAGVDPKFHYTRFELGLQSIMGEQFGAAAAGKKSWDSACEDAQSRMVDMVEAAGGTVVP